MKTVTDRGRKILSRLFRVISVSAASLILQACYGMPPPGFMAEYGMPSPEETQTTSFYGKVVAKETGKPIFGIEISIEGTEHFDYTNKDGYFSFWVPIYQQEYTIKFKDVDGPYHDGLFKEQTWTLKYEDTYKSLLIAMDLDTSNQGQ
jgi:hypothetical protein